MRYQRGAYGGGYYGAVDKTDLIYALEVDWDGDGVYDGSNEAINIIPGGAKITRGRENLIRTDGKGFEHCGIGKAVFTLDNSSGRYDPRNTGSPLYPNVQPGRTARFTAYRYDATGARTEIRLFTGWIDDLQPADKSGKRLTKMTLVDGVSYLKNAESWLPLLQNDRVSTGIDTLLTSAQYPASWGWSLETATDFYPYLWIDGENAWDAINKLADLETGVVFVDRLGRVQFYNRRHIPTYSLRLDGTMIGKNILTRDPWEVIRDTVRINVYPRSALPQEDIFTLSAPIYMTARQTLIITVGLTHGGQATPCALDVFSLKSKSANTNADGSGVDRSMSLLAGIYTIGAQKAKILLTNTLASPFYVTGLVLQGYPLYSGGQVSVVSGSGTRMLLLDSPYYGDPNNAVILGDYLRAFVSQDNQFPVIEVEAQDAALSLELFDNIRLVLPDKGIDDDFRVCKLDQALVSRRIWRSTIWLEPYIKTAGTVWDFPALMGVDTKFGV